MINRWIGILSGALALLINGALVLRDVMPGWLAGEPPAAPTQTLHPGQSRTAQVGIFDARGQNIGRSWTVSNHNGNLVTVNTLTEIGPVKLPEGVTLPRIHVEVDLLYQRIGDYLDELRFDIEGLGPEISLRGEFFPPDQFPCTWHIGDLQGGFVLDASATRALGDIIRPFDRLPGLYVGRSWRMQLFNPLVQAIPGLRENKMLPDSVLVEVTGTDIIEHQGYQVETFIVEADRTRAWATDTGRVLRQIVDIPVLGKLTLLDETYNREMHKNAERRIPGGG